MQTWDNWITSDASSTLLDMDSLHYCQMSHYHLYQFHWYRLVERWIHFCLGLVFSMNYLYIANISHDFFLKFSHLFFNWFRANQWIQVRIRLIERFKCDSGLLWTDSIWNWERYVLDTAVIVVARRSTNYWNRWYVVDTVANDFFIQESQLLERIIRYWNGISYYYHDFTQKAIKLAKVVN